MVILVTAVSVKLVPSTWQLGLRLFRRLSTERGDPARTAFVNGGIEEATPDDVRARRVRNPAPITHAADAQPTVSRF
jgi:hypothetical protein